MLQQVVNFWNLLPEDIVEAESTSRFKQRFDKVMNASLLTKPKMA